MKNQVNACTIDRQMLVFNVQTNNKRTAMISMEELEKHTHTQIGMVIRKMKRSLQKVSSNASIKRFTLLEMNSLAKKIGR